MRVKVAMDLAQRPAAICGGGGGAEAVSGSAAGPEITAARRAG